MTESLNEMEQALIGAIILDEKAMLVSVEAGVRPEWFVQSDCRLLWNWAFGQMGESKPIDILTVSEVCHGSVLPSWPTWLDDAVEGANAANAPYYAKQIKNAWLKRSSVDLLESLFNQVAGTEDSEEFILLASEKMRRLVDHDAVSSGSLKKIAAGLVEDWATKGSVKGLRWPIRGLNEGIGAITDELIYVAAKESLGKSALALQWCTTLAWAGHTVSLRSLESATDKLVQRLISNVGQVNTWKLRTKQGGVEDQRKACLAVERIGEIQDKIRICSAPANIEKLKAWGLMEKQRGSEFLIIDNMKHIRPSQKYSSPVEQFRDISQQLKWMRDDVGLPMLVLHHTNDGGDVSWSKDIRRDVDILVIMTEDETKTIAPGPGNGWVGKRVVQFDVQKNREGAAGFVVSQVFRGDVQTFEDEQSAREIHAEDAPI